MASTMRCWKNSADRLVVSPQQALWLLVALCLSSCQSDPNDQASVSLMRLQASELGADELQLDAQLAHQLSPDIIEALQNGVRMKFRWSVRLDQGKRSMWKTPLMEQDGYFEVAYRSLSQRFTISAIPSGEIDSVDSIALLTETLDEFQARLRLPETLGSDRSGIQISARFFLDINSLPPPLKLPSYLSPAWHMDSGWQSTWITG